MAARASAIGTSRRSAVGAIASSRGAPTTAVGPPATGPVVSPLAAAGAGGSPAPRAGTGERVCRRGNQGEVRSGLRGGLWEPYFAVARLSIHWGARRWVVEHRRDFFPGSAAAAGGSHLQEATTEACYGLSRLSVHLTNRRGGSAGHSSRRQLSYSWRPLQHSRAGPIVSGPRAVPRTLPCPSHAPGHVWHSCRSRQAEVLATALAHSGRRAALAQWPT